MAVAFRNQDQPMFIFIRLAESYVASPETQLALTSGNTRYELAGGFIEKNLFAARDPGFLIENIGLGADLSEILIYHKTINETEYVFAENLLFHHSFFINFFDLAKDSDIYLFQGHYTKPAPVAVAVAYTGDRTLLKFWATYYARLVPPRHLYVLDGSDTQDIGEFLPVEINIVRIPQFSSDPKGFVEASNAFQRFLLSNYQWVMQTSCNEIILHKHGTMQFIKDLRARTAPAILLPDRVYGLTSEAFAASGEKPVGNLPQMVQLPAGEKPILASTPVTWNLNVGNTGLACIQEQHHIMTETYLWLVRFVRNKPTDLSVASENSPFAPREAKEA